jgi:hypothetical protein
MASILNTLGEMERMLRSHGFPELGGRVARLAAEEDATVFAAQICSMEVWGGAGSIVDVTLNDLNDDRRFNELIVDLAEALDQLGLGTPRTRWVGQTIEDWLIANPK